jgi:hypothetical protein
MYIYINTHTPLYISVCACVCVKFDDCIYLIFRTKKKNTHTQKISIYVGVCVCENTCDKETGSKTSIFHTKKKK